MERGLSRIPSGKPWADIVDWCKLEDFEKIGKIWLQVCAQVKEEFEQGLLEGNDDD